MVVLLSKEVEGLLLQSPGPFGRCGRFVFQGAVHPLMSAVLSRFTRFDSFRQYTQLQPPDREARETADGSRGKRRTVVGPDRIGQAVFPKGRFEDRLDHVIAGHLDRLAAKQIAAVIVGNRQRIAAATIPGDKPALEIGAPHRVWAITML